jgi:hypothetical protein
MFNQLLLKIRNRVVAARVERMTPRNAFDTQPGASDNAIAFNGFIGVAGAGRLINTAWRQGRRNKALVDTDPMRLSSSAFFAFYDQSRLLC